MKRLAVDSGRHLRRLSAFRSVLKMTRSISIVAAILLLACACSNPGTLSKHQFGTVPVGAKPSGEVMTTVQGGPVQKNGDHWLPEGCTLAAVLDWAVIDSSYAPKKVYVVTPDGVAITYCVAGRPRGELLRIKLAHGTRVIVPWNRCWAAPNKSLERTPDEQGCFASLDVSGRRSAHR